MPESALAARTFTERVGLDQFGVDDRTDYELRDTVTGPNLDRLVAEIDHEHANLAAKVRVDRAGRIDQGETLGDRTAAARTDLAFVAGRDFEGESSWYGGAGERIEDQRSGKVRRQIESRSV